MIPTPMKLKAIISQGKSPLHGVGASTTRHFPRSLKRIRVCDRMATSHSSPCGACKFMRRKCTSECVFAPYFPYAQKQEFSKVHKVFGASNVAKILSDLPSESRQDAVKSLVVEAEARMKDAVNGCVGLISHIEQRISLLKKEIEILQDGIQKLKEKGIEVSRIESPGRTSESASLRTDDFYDVSDEGNEEDQGGPEVISERAA